MVGHLRDPIAEDIDLITSVMLGGDGNILNEESECFAIIFAIILGGGIDLLYSDFFLSRDLKVRHFSSFLREILCRTKCMQNL